MAVIGSRPAARAQAPTLWYRLANSEHVLGIVCIAPATLLLLVILAVPVVRTLGLAFYSHDLLKPELGTEFVGLANFAWMFDSPRFWIALRNSILLTAVVVLPEMVIAMGVAMLVAAPFRGVGLIRSLFVLPWAIPTVVAAFVWRAMLAPKYGLLNQTIGWVLSVVTGHQQQFVFDWLSDQTWAVVAIAVVSIWKSFPLLFMAYLAGLQSLPQELNDAARIDGANGWQEFWYVTLPQLRAILLVMAILRIINVFNWFDLVWLLTGGGPLDATLTLPILVYNRAFVAYQVGRASAITAVMFVFLTAVVAVLMLAYSRDDHQAASR